MLELFKTNTKIDFVGMFKFCAAASAILVTLSVIGVFTKLKYGVDFRGGAEIQVKFSQQVTIGDVRNALAEAGHESAQVQTIGEEQESEFLVKAMGSDEELSGIIQNIEGSLKQNFADKGVEIRKVDIVGPKAGAQLRLSSFQAMFWALIAIMIYMGLRFDFKYAPGGIIALFHDVAIVLGVYIITGTEFTLQTVGALLAIIGYSINDTVIIYDRVREHEQKYPGANLKELINRATNETLSRSILTSGTVFMVCLTMLILGGSAVHDFFLAMTIGTVVGSYSTIFVATPIMLYFDKISLKGDNKKAVTA